MTKTTTTERFEDGELVYRVTVVEESPPGGPVLPDIQINPSPMPPSVTPAYPWGQPYIGDWPNYSPYWC